MWLAISKLLEFPVSWKKVYIHASYIVFLFIKTEKTNCKRNKTFVRASIAWWKNLAKFVRILEQAKTLDHVSGFHWSALEISQTFSSDFYQL